jgi:hypothetical protein
MDERRIPLVIWETSVRNPEEQPESLNGRNKAEA